MQPKFKVGDKVSLRKKTLYGENEGIIVKGPEKMYRSETGLISAESEIKSIKLPYTFENDILTIHYPEHDFGTWVQKAYTSVSNFYCYAYTVKSLKINTRYLESGLKLS